MATSQDFINWVCGPEISSRYLHYILLMEQESIRRFAHGTTHQTVYYPEAKAFHVCIPERSEQDAIVAVLGALDDKVAVNERISSTAMRIGRADFLRTAFKADKEARVGDVIELKYGKALPATRRIPGSVPVYGSGGISGFHNEALVGGPGIVVGRKGTVGTVYWSEADFFPIDTTFYVTCKTESISLEYAYFALRELGLEYMNSDSAVPGLNRDRVNSLTIKLPHLESLNSFTVMARSIFELQRIREEESRALAALRDTLLLQLMSGRLRVKDVERIVEDAT